MKQDAQARQYNALLITLILFMIVVLVHACFDSCSFLYKTRTEIAMHDINYDSQNDHQPQTFVAKPPEKNNITTIRFRFKPTVLKQNIIIMQTAFANSGIQVTLNQVGAVGVAVNTAHHKQVGLQFLRIAQSNVWHTLEIKAWNGHTLEGRLDGTPPLREILNPDIRYNISKVSVGGKNFSGQIADFTLTTKTIDNEFYQKEIIFLKWLEAFLIVMVIFFFNKMGAKSLERQYKIECLSFIVLVGFFVAIVFHYILGFYWRFDFPNSSFIFYTLGGQFGDFNILLAQDHALTPYQSSGSPGEYFPFAYLLVYPFTWFNGQLSLGVYCLLFVIFIFGFVKFYFSIPEKNPIDRLLNYKNIFILSMLSYPVLFAFERGNLEIILFMLTAVAIYSYQRKNFGMTALCVAMAGAMKLYPLFLLILFISDRRYMLALQTALITVILTLLALCILKPDFHTAFMSFLSILEARKFNCILDARTCIHFNSGIWGALKILQQNGILNVSLLKLFNIYEIMTIFGLFIFSGYVIFVEKVFWRKLAIIFAGILLFPILSFDYKLLYIFIPMAAFVVEKPHRYDLSYLMLLALLFVPKTYYWFAYDTSISGIVTPGILILLSAKIITDGVVAIVPKSMTIRHICLKGHDTF